ncbi:MAG: cysteine desulfurase-like protein [Gemmatimonadota bacterium]|nr:cysteine desulfurase-like protein [Gemmatimonadota bacterium]
MTVASDHEIRSHFPALERRHHGRPVAYFDGPGGTQVPRAVGEAMVDYLYHHNANTHWAYPTSEETDRMLLEARVALAEFLNGRSTEVVFGQNMTTLTFHLARGLGHGWGPGDEVVVTELDHHANRAPWDTLAAERGVTIRVVPFDITTGELDWDAMDRAVGPRTRLVAVGAASNALGTVTDVARVCGMARDRGALSFVDAVHYAPHALVDVQAIGCDFLACSPYKFYGPHMGVLWGREELLAAVDIPRLAPAPAEAPERLETGTLSHESMVGSAAAVDFLAGLAFGAASRRRGLVETFNALHQRGQELFQQLWDGVGEIGGVVRYGPPPDRPRTPTIGFTVAGHTAEAVARHLAGLGVFVSHGDFYAATVVERLGLQETGLVRAGIVCYTTAEEVARLVEGVAELR